MTKTEQQVSSIVLPLIEQLGYELYDVEYVKEGADWYLRVYIDSPNGIDLDDCEKVSNEIGVKLDEEDPISTQYVLEVSSCGLERHLRSREHYKKAIGKNIDVKLYKPINKLKNYNGILLECEEKMIKINTGKEVLQVSIDDISSAKILYNWEE